jgi:hypothetical protein
VFEKLFTFNQLFLTFQLPEPHQELLNGRRREGKHMHIIYNEAAPTKEKTAEWEAVHHKLIKIFKRIYR